MRRRYKSELYRERIAFIKKLMPHCCIGVDVIVGFPCETEELFLETVGFLDEVDVSYLHVFTYSERENTAAYTMEGAVPVEMRKRRNKVLRALSVKKRAHFYNENLGAKRPVLFEKSKEEGVPKGYTDNYVRITSSGSEDMLNEIRNVSLDIINANGDVITTSNIVC